MSVLDLFGDDPAPHPPYHIWRRSLNPDHNAKCIHMWEKDGNSYLDPQMAIAVAEEDPYHAVVLLGARMIYSNGKDARVIP